MVDISYHRKDRDGIPVFSANELENIGDALIKDFAPRSFLSQEKLILKCFQNFIWGLSKTFNILVIVVLF